MKSTLSVRWLLFSCHGLWRQKTRRPMFSPLAKKPRRRTKVLETGTALLQGKQPLEVLNVYMNGFHFYNGNMKGQMEAHHYCSVINEDLNQCVIFDGNGKDAKMMGVEYIVSRRLFDTLPAEEKKLWHSHVHEVKSGQLIAPGVPEVAEHEFMEKIIGTVREDLAHLAHRPEARLAHWTSYADDGIHCRWAGDPRGGRARSAL